MTDWSYLLGDLRTGSIYAEIPLSGANPTKKLNASGTCSGSLPVRAVPGDPYRYTTPARSCLYVLKDGFPWWGGVIWSRSYDSASGVLSISASDWWSYFDHRYILGGGSDFGTFPNMGVTDNGKTAHGKRSYGYTLQQGLVNQSAIVRDLLVNAQAYTGGDLGIEIVKDGIDPYLRQMVYQNYQLVSVGKAFTDLSALDNGPDLMFDTDGWHPDGTARRILRVGTPQLGSTGKGLVFEYGGNLLAYSWQVDGTLFADRTWATGSGSDVSTMMWRADTMTRIDEGWPMVETSTAYSSITDSQMLKYQAASDATQNRLPSVTPKLTVRSDMPPFADYECGDTARVVIQDDYFREGIDVQVRIIDITPDLDTGVTSIDVNPIYEDVV